MTKYSPRVRSWPAVSIPKLPGTAFPLRLYDTATGEVRPVAVANPARMFVCGITPYDATHLGHAFTYLTFDLLYRQWHDQGRAVHYVQNITDVDDPLLERAAATGIDWKQLAEDQIQLFTTDMTELRILPPNDFVAVTDAIDLIASYVQKLIDAGAAYQLEGDWYFRVSADPRFGEVSHYDSETQARFFAERGGDPNRPGKENPLDSLLWRAARDGEPSWETSLGAGRPGWHIECVAIALRNLGFSFDVQGGGSDLIFPHHEMSASCGQVAEHDWPYARHYVHSAMVGYDGEKMSKSRGNLVIVSKLLEAGVDPMAIRLALLANHYRDDWEWTNEVLQAAQQRLANWRAAVSPPAGPNASRAIEGLREALANDLHSERALQAVDEWAETQRLRGGEDTSAPGLMSRAVDALLGIAL